MTDLKEVPAAWLSKFALAVSSGDVAATVDTILPDGWFRDSLVFTWDARTLEGRENISAYLANTLPAAGISNLQLDTDPGLTAEFSPVVNLAVGAGFTFDTRVGHGHGYVHLVADKVSSQWKALAVLMILRDINGHEESGPERGVYGDHTLSWEEVRAERVAKIESDPHVVIIGAGQTGLSVAARFKMMSIPTIVVERLPNVGDVWRKRYPTLTLHTIKNQHSFLYSPFPADWPKFTPRTKLADWMQSYAIAHDLVIWTSSTVLPGPTYDPESKIWTMVVNRNGTEVTLHPRHIVAAVGMLGDPVVPQIPDADKFGGEIVHAGAYMGGQPFIGKRVVVVGAGNTSADICQDLNFRGAAAITMVQRSSTCVVDVHSNEHMMDVAFPPELPTEICDFKSHAVPMTLLRRKSIAEQHLTLAREKELHDKLRKGGIKLNMGPDGSGQYFLVYDRARGYWVDVGCAELIANGQVKVKQGVEPKRFSEKGLVFTDDSEVEADCVIFATGYQDARERLKGVFGAEFIDKTQQLWGLDHEGEITGSYRSSGQPGFWWASGSFVEARFLSKQLALQIKAIEVGLIN